MIAQSQAMLQQNIILFGAYGASLNMQIKYHLSSLTGITSVQISTKESIALDLLIKY